MGVRDDGDASASAWWWLRRSSAATLRSLAPPAALHPTTSKQLAESFPTVPHSPYLPGDARLHLSGPRAPPDRGRAVTEQRSERVTCTTLFGSNNVVMSSNLKTEHVEAARAAKAQSRLRETRCESLIRGSGHGRVQ